MRVQLRLRHAAILATLAVALVGGSLVSAAAPKIDMPGVRIDQVAPDVQLPIISSDVAVSAARAHWDWGAAAQVGVSLVSFSDDQYIPADQSGAEPVFQDRLAWLVTVSGIDFHSLGAEASVNHEVHIVVDALSGQVLELFSYQ